MLFFTIIWVTFNHTNLWRIYFTLYGWIKKKKHIYRPWSNDLGLLLSGDLELDVWLQHLLVITWKLCLSESQRNEKEHSRVDLIAAAKKGRMFADCLLWERRSPQMEKSVWENERHAVYVCRYFPAEFWGVLKWLFWWLLMKLFFYSVLSPFSFLFPQTSPSSSLLGQEWCIDADR